LGIFDRILVRTNICTLLFHPRMQQHGYSYNFQITEDFFNDKNTRSNTPSPRQVQENNEILELQRRLDAQKRPVDATVKESQLVALQEEILILKDKLATVEAENKCLRGCKRKDETERKEMFSVECTGCKNRLCSGSDVLKTIASSDFSENLRQGEDEGPCCLSTGCDKDNVIIGSAKDALIFTEVFYASSVFCNTCLVEVGYCFKQNNNSSIFQTMVNGLYIFKHVQIQKTV